MGNRSRHSYRPPPTPKQPDRLVTFYSRSSSSPASGLRRSPPRSLRWTAGNAPGPATSKPCRRACPRSSGLICERSPKWRAVVLEVIGDGLVLPPLDEEAGRPVVAEPDSFHPALLPQDDGEPGAAIELFALD